MLRKLNISIIVKENNCESYREVYIIFYAIVSYPFAVKNMAQVSTAVLT